jgi:hypothetical protein
MKFVNNNVFIGGVSYANYFSPPPTRYVDSTYVYKFSSAGTFFYRDAFTVPTTTPMAAYTGNFVYGIATYGTEITLYGSQFNHGTGWNNPYFKWFLRKYGPVARMAEEETVMMESNFNIYPNPVIEQMHIESASEILKLSIYDLEGRLVNEVERLAYPDNNLDVSFLKPGVYMIVAETREEKYTRKFVKQ